MAELLRHLGLGKACLFGVSSGSRLSLHVAFTPELVSCLVLTNMTGGALAAKQIGFAYYGTYAEHVKRNGGTLEPLAAAGVYAQNPRNAARFAAAPDAGAFLECMRRSQARFDETADAPVVGVTPEQLTRVVCPAITVFNMPDDSDGMHRADVSESLAAALPGSAGCVASPRQDAWLPACLDFMGRHHPPERDCAALLEWLLMKGVWRARRLWRRLFPPPRYAP